jgi:hypothetical protein
LFHSCPAHSDDLALNIFSHGYINICNIFFAGYHNIVGHRQQTRIVRWRSARGRTGCWWTS